MKIPPRGERERAAAWMAVSVAVLTSIVGTAVLLAMRDDLPTRIVVRQDVDGHPLVRVSLPGFLLCAAALTFGACLLTMALDLVFRHTPRAETSAAAAALPTFLGLVVYSVPLDQRESVDFAFWPLLIALAVAAGVGLGLYGWARQARLTPDAGEAPLPSGSPLVDLPDGARLAWVGASRMAWPIRVGHVTVRLLPLTVVYWWMGILRDGVWIGLVVVPLLLLPGMRHRQLVVDYSGVGLRKSGGLGPPSPVPIAQIRSAEARTISALRDFGGWGRRKRPGGEDAWIARSGEALVVHRIGKPDVTFTVDGAEEAAAVLNTHVARYRAWVAENQSSIDLPAPYGDRV